MTLLGPGADAGLDTGQNACLRTAQRCLEERLRKASATRRASSDTLGLLAAITHSRGAPGGEGRPPPGSGGGGGTSVGGEASAPIAYSEPLSLGPWACWFCTFLNDKPLALVCDVCYTPRGEDHAGAAKSEGAGQGSTVPHSGGPGSSSGSDDDDLVVVSDSRAPGQSKRPRQGEGGSGGPHAVIVLDSDGDSDSDAE